MFYMPVVHKHLFSACNDYQCSNKLCTRQLCDSNSTSFLTLHHVQCLDQPALGNHLSSSSFEMVMVAEPGIGGLFQCSYTAHTPSHCKFFNVNMYALSECAFSSTHIYIVTNYH